MEADAGSTPVGNGISGPVGTTNQSIQHKYQLSKNISLQNNTPLLDALHDATAPFLVKDGHKTVNEDEFFSESKVRTTYGTESVQDRFSRFTKLVSKNQLFESFPITEARVKDIFNGVFIPNFSNYIDPADTSMENFVEFYRKKLRMPNFTLPFEENNRVTDAGNITGYFAEFSTFTYSLNFDKVLFEYFNNTDNPYHEYNKYCDETRTQYVPDACQVGLHWSSDNYKPRHTFILNCIWHETLEYTKQQVVHLSCDNDGVFVSNNCEGGFKSVLLDSIEVLKQLIFTGFADKYKPGIFTTQPAKQYKKFIYKHAQFSWEGHVNSYPFSVSQKVCAEGINKILGETMKGRKGESSADKKRCFVGLKSFFDDKIPEDDVNRQMIIACCYLLLKFLGDTSHLVNYRMLADASHTPGADASHTPDYKFKTSLYCCERPLVVRSIQQNDITLYCKGINILSKLLPIGPGEAYEFQTDETIVLREKASLICQLFSDETMKQKLNREHYERLDTMKFNDPGCVDRILRELTSEDINNLSLFVRLYKSFESIQLFVTSFPNELTSFIQNVVPSALLHRRNRGRVSKLLHIGPYISSFYGNMKNKKKYEKSCLLHTNFYMPLDTLITKLDFILSYSNVAYHEIQVFLQDDMVKQHFAQINVTPFSTHNFSIDVLLSETMDNIDESTMHLMSDIIRSYITIKTRIEYLGTMPAVIPPGELASSSGGAANSQAGGGPDDNFGINYIFTYVLDQFETFESVEHDIYNDEKLIQIIKTMYDTSKIDEHTFNMILRQLPFIKSYIEHIFLMNIYNEQEQEDINQLLAGNIYLAYEDLSLFLFEDSKFITQINTYYLTQFYQDIYFHLEKDEDYGYYIDLTEELEGILISDTGAGYYKSLHNILVEYKTLLLPSTRLARHVTLEERGTQLKELGFRSLETETDVPLYSPVSSSSSSMNVERGTGYETPRKRFKSSNGVKPEYTSQKRLNFSGHTSNFNPNRKSSMSVDSPGASIPKQIPKQIQTQIPPIPYGPQTTHQIPWYGGCGKNSKEKSKTRKKKCKIKDKHYKTKTKNKKSRRKATKKKRRNAKKLKPYLYTQKRRQRQHK